jgi:hypothetical protein
MQLFLGDTRKFEIFNHWKRYILIFSYNLDFAHFLGSSSERGFLQLNKFLGRAKNADPSKFITLELASLWNLNSKNVQSRDNEYI